jgi:hypothetical protein
LGGTLQSSVQIVGVRLTGFDLRQFALLLVRPHSPSPDAVAMTNPNFFRCRSPATGTGEFQCRRGTGIHVPLTF